MKKLGLMSVWGFAMGAVVSAWAMRVPERVAEDFVFAEDGRAKAAIVCAQPDAANVRYAANELADFLGRLTGARFAVVDEPVEGFASIRVGDAYEAKAPEELHIEVRSADELILTGEAPRGAMYAVYDLLESFGCGFYQHDYDYVPPVTNRLALAVGYEKTDAPYMTWRSMWSQLARSDFAWNMKLRVHDGPEAKWKEYGFLPRPNNDGIAQILCTGFVSRKKYFEKHPEWYAYVKARNERSGHWVCVQNEEMFKVLFADIEEYIAAHPGVKEVPVGLDDGAERCECEKCLALCAADGDKTGIPSSAVQYVVLMNRIGKHFKEKYPGIRFNMLAYDNMGRAPLDAKKWKLEPNVGVAVALLWKDHCRPAYLCDRAERSIEGWTKLTANGIYNWDYYANFWSYIIPFPNYDILGKNFRYYKACNQRGFSSQMQFTFCGDLAEMHYWLYAKLCWDPDADTEALIEEYVKNVYGTAAKSVRRYIELMLHARDRQRGGFYGCYVMETDQYLTGKDVFEIWRIGEDCARAAKRDEAHREAIVRVTTAMRLLAFMRYADLVAEAAKVRCKVPSRAEIYRGFLSTMDSGENLMSQDWSEGFSGTRLFDVLVTNKLGAAVMERPESDVMRVIGVERMKGGRRFSVKEEGGEKFARLATDFANEDLYQVYMNPQNSEVEFEVKGDELGEWVVFATVRTATTAEKDVGAAYMGIYEDFSDGDYRPLRWGRGFQQQLAELSIEGRKGDLRWRTFCLGKFNLKATARVWVMPGVLNRLEYVDVKNFVLVNAKVLTKGVNLNVVRSTVRGAMKWLDDKIDRYRAARLDFGAAKDEAEKKELALTLPLGGKVGEEKVVVAQVRIGATKAFDLEAVKAEILGAAAKKGEARPVVMSEDITANVDEEVWQTIVLGKVKIEKGMELRLRKGDGADLKWIDLKGVYLVDPKVLGM